MNRQEDSPAPMQKWVKYFSASLECASEILTNLVTPRHRVMVWDEKDSWYTFQYHYRAFRELLKLAGEDIEGLRMDLGTIPVLRGDQDFVDTFRTIDQTLFTSVLEQTAELGEYVKHKCHGFDDPPQAPTGDIPVAELVVTPWEDNVNFFDSSLSFKNEVVRQIHHMKHDVKLSKSIIGCFAINLEAGLPFKYMVFMLTACKRSLDSLSKCRATLKKRVREDVEWLSPVEVEQVDGEFIDCQKEMDQARELFNWIETEMRELGRQYRFNRRLVIK